MVKKTIIPATKKLGKELIKEASPEHKLRVCAYVRVSTDSEEQLESFNAQIGRYKRIIQEEHADTWEYVGIFADTESGTSIDKREEFQDMMDKCREGLIDLILVKQMSRFGRNTINTLQAIYELRNLGVEVYFETDELYASNSKLDFMLTMYSALAQEESRQQSVRVSSGIHERMESGNISKRVRPILGYRKDSFDKIYIYEPEAIAIRTVFMLFVSNIKMHDVDRFIRRDFASLNFSKTFRTRMYESIISNPRYKGDVVLQKTFKSKVYDETKKETKSKNIIFAGEIKDPNLLNEIYKNAKATLILSKVETFSMVVAESLINGTPVFGFKAGGPESISIEQYSFFVDYGDINSLIGKMKDYDYNSVDKNTIRIIARKKFSMDTIAKQYKNLYFDLLSKNEPNILYFIFCLF